MTHGASEPQASAVDGAPVWMLDVDGVVNAFRPSWGAELARTHAAGFPIRYAPALIDRIRAIHASGTVEIRWSTTWCGYPHQLEQLGDLFNLDFPAAFGDRPMSKTWADLKVEAALDVLASGRRLVWTDDSEVDAARRLSPAIAAAEREGQALLIAPEGDCQRTVMDNPPACGAPKGWKWGYLPCGCRNDGFGRHVR